MRARPRGSALSVEWRWLGAAAFREPFFLETVQLALERPYSLLFPRETAVDTLAEVDPGLAPSGFVLHMSRCGSTLVTQMLAASPRILALSEPPLPDDVVRATADEDERAHRFRLAVRALGRRESEAYVVKLAPWATTYLPTIRRAFPETPWLFIGRDPAAVLASNLRQVGRHMLPSVVPPALFGIDAGAAATMGAIEYGARVLGAICRDAREARDERALFLDYRELPGAIDSVLDHFGIAVDDEEHAAMERAGRRDAKVPSRAFEPRELPTTAELRAAVDRWARPAYEALSA